MKNLIRTIYISMLIISPGFGLAQTGPETVKMPANTTYNKAGKFKRLMLGDHYRKDWATAVDIEVLDMETEAGGLTPVKLGGGKQTKSLRMKGADGKEYVLRSVNKDPSKAIAAELRGTFAEDLVQDQISSANPYAPIVVSSLAEAAGILHNDPKLVYVPASARLGKYKDIFAGTLCLFEERAATEDQLNANDTKKIVNSQKMLEKVFANSDHRVDEKAYLKARMFDMLIGDWDRHEDQWQWAVYKAGDQTVYRPIPRDRDQAFSRMDGVIPELATSKWALRKIQGFDHKIDDIAGLNTAAIHLDKNFTTRLTLMDWIAVATELQQSITDKVIDSSCRLFPKEIYELSGKDIAAKLKTRRDDLQKYARKYYGFISRSVNIVGTNGKEIFEVNRFEDGSTNVAVYKADKNGNQQELIYERLFLLTETQEIRLYGLDGADRFNIWGTASHGIMVRAIGGNGMDRFTDKSSVKGLAHKTKIYDDEKNTFNTGYETKKFISNDSLANNYNRKGYRYDWLAPIVSPGYNPDDGIYIGGGIVFKKQQFGKSPYGFIQSVGGSYAMKTSAYTFWYKATFKQLIGKWDLKVAAEVNAPNYSRNYFGMGNETVKLDEQKNSYYRARYDQVTNNVSIVRQFGKNHQLELGTGFETVKVEQKNDRFISSENAKLDSADFGRKYYASVKGAYQFSTLNNELYPTKGMKFISGMSFVQDIKESDKHYVQVYAEVSNYLKLWRLTLASRTGVSANIGNNYQFFQANTLGSGTNLRGYRKDRFAGKTTLYSNTELRYNAGFVNGYFLRGTWGLLAFMDNGRVWVPGEDSNVWHQGYGTGIWFMPFNMMALTATYGMSKEDNVFSIKAGFLF